MLIHDSGYDSAFLLIHSEFCPRLTRPTLFEYYRGEKGVPPTKCWTIFGKGLYAFGPYSSHPAYGGRFSCSATGDSELRIVKKQKCATTIYNLMSCFIAGAMAYKYPIHLVLPFITTVVPGMTLTVSLSHLIVSWVEEYVTK